VGLHVRRRHTLRAIAVSTTVHLALLAGA
jgi:hypothetical protein